MNQIFEQQFYLLANLVNFEKLLPFAVFGMCATGAWFLLDYFSGNNDRTLERLEEIQNPSRRRKKSTDELLPEGNKKKAMAEMLERTTPFAKPLQPKTEAETQTLKSKLSMGGFRRESAVSIFLGLKFLGLIIGLFLSGAPLLLTKGFSQTTLIYTVVIAGLFFYLPDLVLFFFAKHRKDAIFYGLPDCLDLLVVCVESGLGLDQALRKVTEEMQENNRIVSEEFGICNFQLQMGRPRSEVLHELGLRTGVDDLRSLAAILIQADKFGSSIAQALRVQSDSMRTRRRQLAEEKAAKTAVQLIFPLVLFIFPGIFVVLVGPAAITIIRQMLTTMS